MNHFGWALSSQGKGAPSVTLGTAVGIPVFIFSVGLLWKFIHLRGDTDMRLRRTVDIAFVRLTDQVMKIFEMLNHDLTIISTGSTESLDPAKVIIDPSVVEPTVKMSLQLLKRRRILFIQFKRLLRICTCLTSISWTFAGSAATAMLAYLYFYPNRVLWVSAVRITCATVILGILLFIAYAVFNSKIQRSIEISNPVKVPGKVATT